MTDWNKQGPRYKSWCVELWDENRRLRERIAGFDEPWEPDEQIWEPGGGSYTTRLPRNIKSME